ncbi:protein inscuteable homolog [Centruroides vittatus]|uniref:protein inscuteable homolog n=1 Tax=Centruroides vittatus TaxID=120091 RepID=UPI00350FA7A4
MGQRIGKLSGQDTPVLKRVSSASTPLLNNNSPTESVNNNKPSTDSPQYPNGIRISTASSTPHLPTVGIPEEVETPILRNHANTNYISNNLNENTNSPEKVTEKPLYENFASFKALTPSPQTSTPKKSPRMEEIIYEEITSEHLSSNNYYKEASENNCNRERKTSIDKIDETYTDMAPLTNQAKNQSAKTTLKKEIPERCSEWTSTSIQKWLYDLHTLTETECLSTLQGKDLTQCQFVRISQDAVVTLNKLTNKVNENFNHCIKTAIHGQWSNSCKELCIGINNLAKYYEINITFLHLSYYKPKMEEMCRKLEELSKKNEDRIEIILENFRKEVERHTRILITYNLHTIVQMILKGNDAYSLKTAITSLITLAEISDVIRYLISKVGGINALLEICTKNKDNSLILLALRALSVVCSTPSTVEKFVKAGGIECITHVFQHESVEEIRSEAAGLLTQITAPWMDKCGLTVSKLKFNINYIISSLTDLIETTFSEEVFLLATSALANLSYLDSESCNIIKECGTVQKLITKYRLHTESSSSLYIKDQMATIFANMATSFPHHVSDTGGVVLLLCFLQLRPSLMHSKAEKSACERILQKSAIAISRLSSYKDISSIIIEMQGIHRLVRLCKDRKERNDSDTVLIACLAAIKKISASQDVDIFKKLNADDLVESHIWDSFLIYSSKLKLDESKSSSDNSIAV